MKSTARTGSLPHLLAPLEALPGPKSHFSLLRLSYLLLRLALSSRVGICIRPRDSFVVSTTLNANSDMMLSADEQDGRCTDFHHTERSDQMFETVLRP